MSSKTTVLSYGLPQFVRPYLDEQLARLPEVIHVSGSQKNLIKGDYDALFFFGFDELAMVRIDRIRFVQLFSAGFDFLPEAWQSKHILYAANGGANAQSVAEHTIMLALALNRKLIPLTHSILQGDWQRQVPVQQMEELKAKTFGILGLGRIGSLVAKFAQGIGCHVIYNDICEIQCEHATSVSIETLFRESNILSLHVPLTPETEHVINEQVLEQLPSGAILINTARGKLIDYSALRRNVSKLGGIGLDVFETEPVIPSDLIAHPNAIYTPHRAGASYQNWFNRVDFAVNNLRHYLAGEVLSDALD